MSNYRSKSISRLSRKKVHRINPRARKRHADAAQVRAQRRNSSKTISLPRVPEARRPSLLRRWHFVVVKLFERSCTSSAVSCASISRSAFLLRMTSSPTVAQEIIDYFNADFDGSCWLVFVEVLDAELVRAGLLNDAFDHAMDRRIGASWPPLKLEICSAQDSDLAPCGGPGDHLVDS